MTVASVMGLVGSARMSELQLRCRCPRLVEENEELTDPPLPSFLPRLLDESADYCATKAAVIQLHESLKFELKSQ